MNDEIVHGMPSAKRKLKKGDIVSIDTGVQLDGYYRRFGGYGAGGRSERADQEAAASDARESLELAIDKVRPGNRLFDICGRCRSMWKETGFRLCGRWWATASARSCMKSRRCPITWTGENENPRLREGMVLAIEPMVNAGRAGYEDAGRTSGRP